MSYSPVSFWRHTGGTFESLLFLACGGPDVPLGQSTALLDLSLSRLKDLVLGVRDRSKLARLVNTLAHKLSILKASQLRERAAMQQARRGFVPLLFWDPLWLYRQRGRVWRAVTGRYPFWSNRGM